MSSAKQELEALWREVFGEPPSINADPAMLSEILVRHLPPAPPYIDGEGAAASVRPPPDDDPNDPSATST
ncbi:MAG TPA: hypothetical protein VN805_00180 [Caulobacteraceae bacterium]|nr:hypothetical protein [Caulobacteraceae bacterium]